MRSGSLDEVPRPFDGIPRPTGAWELRTLPHSGLRRIGRLRPTLRRSRQLIYLGGLLVTAAVGFECGLFLFFR